MTSLKEQSNEIKVFFIIGCERSGTTALARLLYQHPEIEVVPEIKIIQSIISLDKKMLFPKNLSGSQLLYKKIKAAIDKSKYLNSDREWDNIAKDVLVRALEEFHDSQFNLEDFLNKFYYIYAKKKGVEIVIHKEPSMIYFIEKLENLLEKNNFKYIHLIRNGINVANSIKLTKNMPEDDFRCTMRWVRATKIWQKLIKNDKIRNKFVKIYYEDLIAGEDKFLKATNTLSQFLEVQNIKNEVLTPLMDRDNSENSTSTKIEKQNTEIKINKSETFYIIKGELKKLGFSTDSNIPDINPFKKITISVKKFFYWLRVYHQKIRGRLYFR